MSRTPNITTYYRPEQVLSEEAAKQNYSKSPIKPKILIDTLKAEGLDQYLSLNSTFTPLAKEDFRQAHTAEYVDAFFKGDKKLCETSGLTWSDDLKMSVSYTNASLVHSVMHALDNPREVVFSPTSGFHHAKPGQGAGFCTFSGQVIASLKAFQERGAKGAYLDLDAHYGNSIEDSRAFVPELNEAVPRGLNINPEGKHEEYIANCKAHLKRLEPLVLGYEIDYLVFCHGADSHQADDLEGGQCTTEEWLECSKIFYQWVNKMDQLRGDPIPLVLSLFGGYRHDDYGSVISLHIADLVECLNTLCGRDVKYDLKVKEN